MFDLKRRRFPESFFSWGVHVVLVLGNISVLGHCLEGSGRREGTEGEIGPATGAKKKQPRLAVGSCKLLRLGFKTRNSHPPAARPASQRRHVQSCQSALGKLESVYNRSGDKRGDF
jgi:hypothetical protein